jgi:cyclopropane-fatty-acyl-phospholipid synthase
MVATVSREISTHLVEAPAHEPSYVERQLEKLYDRSRAQTVHPEEAKRLLQAVRDLGPRLEKESASVQLRARRLEELLTIAARTGVELGGVPGSADQADRASFDRARAVYELERRSQAGRISNPQRTAVELLALAGVQIDGSAPWDIRVHDDSFYRRVLSDPELKLGEAYMDGLWDCAAIDQLTYRLSARKVADKLHDPTLLARTPLLLGLAQANITYRHLRDLLTNRQTRERSPTVAEEHYDAGNELYRRMLDPTLTYTCGIWAPGYTLEDAQNAKYDLLCRKLGLQPGDRVLDIGCGFGGFARFAAKNYGAHVTGITISVEQLKAARALSVDVDGTDFIYSDYRDIPNRFPPDTFDHVVSIEMIEAVGYKNLKDYFSCAHACLKDGGRFALQALANNIDVVNTNAWFSKYIFHDGVAPSRNQVDRAARQFFGAPTDEQRFTPNYDRTLLAWHDNFHDAWDDLKGSYSDRFKRMWEFYLLSVAGSFRSEDLQLDQVVYTKGADRGGPPVRDLPTRERLDALRTTAMEQKIIAGRIAELEREKEAIAKASAPKATQQRVPLAKDARICILGAGPSGLTCAHELKSLGFTNVVVLEKERDVGGKSHTVEIDGRPHDLGATMGIKYKYSDIERLGEMSGAHTVPFPREVHYDLAAGGPAPPQSFGGRVKQLYQGLRYAMHHAHCSKLDERGLEVPPSELADPFPVIMRRRGLQEFGRSVDTYLTGYGYGDPATTPAVFGYRMLDLRAVAGAGTRRSFMWENGTTPIWRGLAEGLDVRTSTAVSKIERHADGVDVFIAGANEPERFDRLVVACDAKAALRLLDATPEEDDLFSQIRHMPYSTFACRVEGIAEGKAEVGYLKENMRMDRMGHPMAWIKRYVDDDVFVFHLFAPKELSDEDVLQKITADMKRLGATRVTLAESRRWDFFPHVDADSMRLGKFFERAQNTQGANRTVYVNEVLAMSTMADVAGYAKKVAARLASGEYSDLPSP